MSGKSEDVRRKAAAMATEQKAKERRRRLLMFSGAGAAVVAVVAVGVISGLSGSLGSATAGTSTSSAQSPAQGSAQAPPWAAPTDAASRAQAAGLTMLTAEGTAEHIHTHLSITADGKAITVPADVGIDLSAQLISPLHTHDTSGIIHVESPVQKGFTLGEFFTEWNVALSAKQLGSYTTAGGYTITTFVNGTKYAGDAADIALAEHEDVDIVISTGSSQASAPAAFSWPAGY
ncbi:hypothetical protein [Arthrobacter sp. GMC3]|uniref:hypothetical protein n=1 Tax=Arthrobacter sp. GMC3 TaxID=2058894 RepID=UPI000CE3D712|nr:hypothetical protein [Arthrobacter sp. GMC3]